MVTVDFRARLIDELLLRFRELRYVAVYCNEKLLSKQRVSALNSSPSSSDQYEELLVNPALLTLARQRGNIDCGGLRFVLVAYGSFYQLIKAIQNGHLSICLDKNANVQDAYERILVYLDSAYPEL